MNRRALAQYILAFSLLYVVSFIWLSTHTQHLEQVSGHAQSIRNGDRNSYSIRKSNPKPKTVQTQAQKSLGVFKVGYCEDSHQWFPKVIGPLIFPELDTQLVLVDLEKHEETNVDFIWCYTGASAIVKRKIERGHDLYINRNLNQDQIGKWDSNNIYRRKSYPTFKKPVKPFVAKYNTEPWSSGVSSGGLDLMVDCKTDPKFMDSMGAPTMYMPYIFGGFSMRTIGKLADVVHERSKQEIQEIIEAKVKFCGFAASYCSARTPSANVRSIFFDMLSRQYRAKQPDALGYCLPRTANGRRAPGLINTPEFDSTTLDNVVQTYHPYKFVLAFENSQEKGYLTEKILNAYLAKSIPIYFGALDADNMLNRKAFIFCQADFTHINFHSLYSKLGSDKYKLQDYVVDHEPKAMKAFKQCIDQIIEVDNDPELYKSMLAEPLLLNNSLYPFMDPAYYAKLIRNYMIAQEWDFTKSITN